MTEESLNKLTIWVRSMTSQIYIGVVKGNKAVVKRDITDVAIDAVARHLDREQCGYKFENGQLLRLIDDELDSDDDGNEDGPTHS